MSDFDTLLAKFTQNGNAQVHGAIMKCVDKHGREFQGLIVLGSLLMLTPLPRQDDLFQDLRL